MQLVDSWAMIVRNLGGASRWTTKDHAGVIQAVSTKYLDAKRESEPRRSRRETLARLVI